MNKKHVFIKRIQNALDLAIAFETPVTFTFDEAELIKQLIELALAYQSCEATVFSEDVTNETN